MPGGPAQQAGLRSGDRLLSVDGTPVADKMHAIQLIRASAASGVQGAPRPLQIRAERNGSVVELTVQPRLSRGDKPVPMIEAAFSGRPQMVTIRYGFIEGLAAAARQTWEMSAVTLTMLGRIVTLQASPDNISGPLTIAAYAGRSAELGLSQFLSFLAVVSVSLGVLNLLPLPILDGGRLMYHLFEGVTGRPIPVEWRDRLLRGGLAIMLLVMSLALYNDVVRFLGPQT
jgi:regulator of sigma E protease